jgi:hypothetical protein
MWAWRWRWTPVDGASDLSCLAYNPTGCPHSSFSAPSLRRVHVRLLLLDNECLLHPRLWLRLAYAIDPAAADLEGDIMITRKCRTNIAATLLPRTLAQRSWHCEGLRAFCLAAAEYVVAEAVATACILAVVALPKVAASVLALAILDCRVASAATLVGRLAAQALALRRAPAALWKRGRCRAMPCSSSCSTS